jgi:hypothetical protein
VISWRYHLISIVAVFLALALGVLAGSTVIKQNLIAGLQQQTSSLESRLSSEDHANTTLTDQVGALNSAIDALAQNLLVGKLVHQQVILLTPDNVDHKALTQVQTDLGYAGADIVATLSVNVDQRVDRSALASALGAPSSWNLTQLVTKAAHELAGRLESGAIATQQADDILYKVLYSGLLRSSTSFKTLSVGGPAVRVVVIGPTDATQSSPPPSEFIDPFVRDLVSFRVPVAVGSSSSAAPAFLGPIQQTDPGEMVTVNDLETPAGGVALVLGLERLISTHKGGDWGVGSGTSGVMPTPSGTP